jgi:hypothetical protein
MVFDKYDVGVVADTRNKGWRGSLRKRGGRRRYHAKTQQRQK